MIWRWVQCASWGGLETSNGSLGPDEIEDESRHHETEENSDDAIANIIEIGVWRIALEDAVEESECDL